jgi:hypothetical protein
MNHASLRSLACTMDIFIPGPCYSLFEKLKTPVFLVS